MRGLIFDKCKKEIKSAEALIELNTAEAALKWFRLCVKRMDRDDAFMNKVIRCLRKHGETTKANKLRRMQKGTIIKVEELGL